MDIVWANKQLPAGVIREDVCVWIPDGDGSWCTSCGSQFEFTNGGPEENEAHFCYHCGGVLLAETFLDDTPVEESMHGKSAGETEKGPRQ
jgi:rRNA maturation endonuclease Nob1